MDRCLKIEHARYIGRMHVLGFNTNTGTLEPDEKNVAAYLSGEASPSPAVVSRWAQQDAAEGLTGRRSSSVSS